ncbi:TPA: hypothetical protein MZO75_004497, partial [Salmonella enterica]|nr:hypothetical protein [Salmonella enterica]
MACSVCPGGMTSGGPVNPLPGRRCCRGRPTSRCPARGRSYSPAPNQANTGIQKLVDSLISERGQSTGKKPGRCEMLEELIADGRF